jgi:hypothetical protein
VVDGRRLLGGDDRVVSVRHARSRPRPHFRSQRRDAGRPGVGLEARPLRVGRAAEARQRATGTSASNSISSASFASVTVFGQVMASRPSRSLITQPESRLVWNVPSLSLRVPNAGLVSFLLA